jgi:hypothetical protein
VGRFNACIQAHCQFEQRKVKMGSRKSERVFSWGPGRFVDLWWNLELVIYSDEHCRFIVLTRRKCHFYGLGMSKAYGSMMIPLNNALAFSTLRA